MNQFKIGSREVDLKPELLCFKEENVNNFLRDFAANYDHYSELHALATAHHDKLETDYEVTKERYFVAHREDGKAEKTAQSMALIKEDVMQKRDAVTNANYKARRLAGYLRSMDKAYESAREFCFNLRKELDKIYGL